MVTGASKGIRRELALAFAREGAFLILCSEGATKHELEQVRAVLEARASWRGVQGTGRAGHPSEGAAAALPQSTVHWTSSWSPRLPLYYS